MRLLTFSLAVLLAVTSQHMAVARGAMADVAGQVVLCTGQGVQTVSVDRQGQPVEIVHICPDCALTLFEGTGPAPDATAAFIHIHTLVHGVDIPWFVWTPFGYSAARGPPLIV